MESCICFWGPTPADGGKYLIPIQATSVSSDNNNTPFGITAFPPLKGFSYLLLHTEASWLTAGETHVPSWFGGCFLGLCWTCHWVAEARGWTRDQGLIVAWRLPHPLPLWFPEDCLWFPLRIQLEDLPAVGNPLYSRRPRESVLSAVIFVPHVAHMAILCPLNVRPGRQ